MRVFSKKKKEKIDERNEFYICRATIISLQLSFVSIFSVLLADREFWLRNSMGKICLWKG